MHVVFRQFAIACLSTVLSGCLCHYGPGAFELSKTDHQLAAHTYYSSCPGKPQGMEVTLDSAGRFPRGPGNVFSAVLTDAVAKTWPIMATFGDSGLYIDYDPRVQILKQEREVLGVRIIYRPNDRLARP